MTNRAGINGMEVCGTMSEPAKQYICRIIIRVKVKTEITGQNA